MKKAWLVAELMFAFTAVLLFLIACAYMFPKRVDHDIWDIATAIGTVGAAVAAVWIATNEARRRKNMDVEIARLTAAGMVWRLRVDLATVDATMRLLARTKKPNASAEAFTRLRQELENVCTWKINDLLPLAPLPRHCAVNLASAGDQVRACIYRMKLAGIAKELDTLEGRQRLAGDSQKMLREAAVLLWDALKVCESAAKEGKGN